MDQRFVTAEDVFRWMDETCVQAIQPGLDRMEWALDRLGHPERRMKWIHIAGTNGKGSTAAMVAKVLEQAGYPVGMFTSPYLMHWSERIRFDGENISEESFVRWANELKPVVEEMIRSGVGQPSPFEFWTLLAICYFAKEALPWFIVWETGLGGRWDATNVVYPLVSVITNVGHDHIHLLGDSLSQIAEEKAGIIKPGVPVVCGCEDETAVRVIEEKVKTGRSSLYLIGRDYAAEMIESTPSHQRIRFRNMYRTLEEITIPLAGEHQVKNAATAMMTLEVLRQFYATVLEDEDVLAGFSKVQWPGRLEKVADDPPIWLDGAHNPEGAEALAAFLSKQLTYRRLHLLLSVMEDKEVERVLRPLVQLAEHIVITQADHPRAMKAERLAGLVRSLTSAEVETADTPEQGLNHLRQRASADDLIMVTGSLFLVSDIRKHVVSGENQG
ncbi:bifunctional folylpolyglutamate synthase/dihydrofolate synthase [Polycladomyces sp. WAk]|uniref:tetrahydrofolate synthase n=1 Tax=Polycladomyces zharkentensis TaxID=2807616 RepID=A0ABS2WKY3_9BACL|nr:folylpolyglutamate synthase/dihydrofolate synthase family protein [Polycladomyces sp. WAk]MBN2910189.1 bifunctional folylpolyglutamate synthase/dihydrofolate synthase [Polycladomyces sp. WAk]